MIIYVLSNPLPDNSTKMKETTVDVIFNPTTRILGNLIPTGQNVNRLSSSRTFGSRCAHLLNYLLSMQEGNISQRVNDESVASTSFLSNAYYPNRHSFEVYIVCWVLTDICTWRLKFSHI